MAKTIKQLADELGIDKQRVYRHIKKHHINDVHQKDGMMYIDEAAELLIKQEILNNCASSDVHQNHINDTVGDVIGDVINDELKSQLNTLQTAFEMLQGQLIVKDEQITALQAELATERQHSREQADKIVVLADQSQRLQLAQITSSEQTVLIEDKNKQPKIGLFHRLFNKKAEK